MNELQTFVDLIAKYGLWVVFAGLWWLERGERKELQKQRNDQADKSLTAYLEVAAALKELRYVIRGRVDD